MQSKRFRNEQFCVGDLVAPNWNPETPFGLGVVLEINANRWNERYISVCWQLKSVTQESPIDLQLLEQAVD